MATPHRIISTLLERIERAPFQVALLLQDEAIESAHDRFSNPEVGTATGSCSLPASTYAAYLTLRTRPRTFTAFGPEIGASLSWIGLLISAKPDLVDGLDDLDADLLELRQRFVLELEGRGRLVAG